MNGKKVYIETYGCQMNLSDTEIVSSILESNGYSIIKKVDSADVILLNTCSVRENAERKIFERLMHLKQYKKKKSDLIVGIIGCMAERLQDKVVEGDNMVNLTAGPDDYRNLHHKINQLVTRETTSFDKLRMSLDTKFFNEDAIKLETYNDITPLRTDGISAWISIMRGCNNFCSYCVVPYTRGRERARPLKSILAEVDSLSQKGFKEITLLGQNVNSYKCQESNSDFPDLLTEVAKKAKNTRFRFMTSHPKDISDKLIETIADNENICNHIHFAMQSGSNNVLKRMNRRYTIEHFLERVEKIKELIPNCSLTTDVIAGFPGETIEDHQATLKAMEVIEYDTAFMFRYSPREGTKAFNLIDDVAEEEKIRRLNEIIHLQQKISKKLNADEIGKIYEVLVESVSKKSNEEWFGRTKTNKVVIFPFREGIKQGNVINVKIVRSTSATLFGKETH